MLVAVTFYAVVLLAGDLAFADNVPPCQNSPRIGSRTDNLEPCEERQVCGDKWTMTRDWHNGTRCVDDSVLFNCRCPDADGADPCPVNDEDHAVHASRQHKRYLCEPACDLSMCQKRWWPAVEMVERFRENKRYYRVNCRCAAHSSAELGHSRRTSRFQRLSWNPSEGIYFHQYVCSQGGRYPPPDPCAAR